MNIDEIETFVAIAELGGFTSAGRRLHRTQPAISRRSAFSSTNSARRCSNASAATHG